MRRKEREITDIEEIISVIDNCEVMRVALMDNEGLYIVPMNFGFTYENGKLTFYAHGAREGRKFDAMKGGTPVCVEMDCDNALMVGKAPCAYSYFYSSVIANGTAKAVNDVNEKINALTLIMKHQTKKDFTFEAKHAAAVAVFKIDIDTFTAKRHLSK